MDTRINDKALQDLLNLEFVYGKTLSEASGDLSVDVDSKYKENAYRLKENILKLKVLDTSRVIVAAVNHHYRIIEEYVAQETIPLINRINQLEKIINHHLENNNQSTPEVKALEREKNDKKRELDRFNLLLEDPTIVLSFVLEDFHIRGNANDLIDNIISSDQYVNEHYAFFASSKDRNIQINEANIALALEVLHGNNTFYDMLVKVKIINRGIKQLENPEIMRMVKQLNDSITTYCQDYSELSQIEAEERTLRRENDRHHQKGTRKQILHLQELYNQLIQKLYQDLSQIRKDIQYFEHLCLGTVDLKSLFKSFSTLKRMAFTDSPNNPFVYQYFIKFINGKLEKEFAREIRYELESQKASKEKYLQQVPEEMRNADPNCAIDIKDISNPKITTKYDRDSSIIALLTLLVINGLKKGAVYNKLILPDDRTKIWNQVKQSIDKFINGDQENTHEKNI